MTNSFENSWKVIKGGPPAILFYGTEDPNHDAGIAIAAFRITGRERKLDGCEWRKTHLEGADIATPFQIFPHGAGWLCRGDDFPTFRLAVADAPIEGNPVHNLLRSSFHAGFSTCSIGT